MKKHYYTIGEVGNLLELKPYVIRYWESEFSQLRPRKDDGRIRKYSEENILLLKKIKDMLYMQKFTIEGARQKLKNERKVARDSYKKDEQIELPFLLESEPQAVVIDPALRQQVKELRDTLSKLKSQCEIYLGRYK